MGDHALEKSIHPWKFHVLLFTKPMAKLACFFAGVVFSIYLALIMGTILLLTRLSARFYLDQTTHTYHGG
ncbi:MAG: hypothetical protein R6U17_09545 [Thermoplasmata archaeon]